MPVQSLKYCEYFDVNEKYFPCIDESAINSGAAWDTTYPHQTFVDLLTLTEKMLSGNTNRSIWIHGAYGTGKSQCAYTLKKLLEVPENEVRAYWDKFEPLKKNPVLLEKLIGHKAQGIVTAYRYASGSISVGALLVALGIRIPICFRKHYYTTTAFLRCAGKHQEGLGYEQGLIQG